MRERGEELVLQLRLVMQPLLAVFHRRAGFLGFVGAAFGFFLRLAELGFDLLALADVDQQPLALGGERGLLLLLQRYIAERPEDAGQAAVGIALWMGAEFDVHDAAVFGDHARFANHFVARAGTFERLLDVGAIFRMDQRQAGPGMQFLERVAQDRLEAAGCRVDHDLVAQFDAGMEGEVGGQLADQAMKTFTLAQPRLLDQQPFARSIQVAA